MKNLVSAIFLSCIFTSIICLLISCNDYDKRIIVKTIRIDKNKSIELYRYSQIGGYSAYYVDLKNENGKFKHIFIHENICHVDLKEDTLSIVADKAFKTIFCEKKDFGLKMLIDTSTYCLQ